MLIIPADRLGEALEAVATRRAHQVALDLDVSVTTLVHAALLAAGDAETYAAYPRACRRILDRREAAQASRSARRLDPVGG